MPLTNLSAELTPEVEAEIVDMMEYHPWNAHQTARGVTIRAALTDAIRIIIANAPPCADRSTAIRKIREARMDCNSAITHGGKY